MLRLAPVDKSSKHVTRASKLIRASQSQLPIKPAPPVTKNFFPSKSTRFKSRLILSMSSRIIESNSLGSPAKVLIGQGEGFPIGFWAADV